MPQPVPGAAALHQLLALQNKPSPSFRLFSSFPTAQPNPASPDVVNLLRHDEKALASLVSAALRQQEPPPITHRQLLSLGNPLSPLLPMLIEQAQQQQQQQNALPTQRLSLDVPKSLPNRSSSILDNHLSDAIGRLMGQGSLLRGSLPQSAPRPSPAEILPYIHFPCTSRYLFSVKDKRYQNVIS